MAQRDNIDTLKRDVRISDWLTRQGYKIDTSRSKPGETWFFSPFFRNARGGVDEKTSSFKVVIGNRGFEIWNGFGSHDPEKGGDIFKLIQDLNGTNFKGALEEVKSFHSNPIRSKKPANSFQQQKTLPLSTDGSADPQLKFLSEFEFSGHKSDFYQLDYISRKRGIHKGLVARYLKKVKFYNLRTKKNYWAIGWQNRSRGWDVRNEHFKGCLEAKDITVIADPDLPKELERVSIFEGMIDFLTILTWAQKQKINGPAIILNGTSLASRAIEFLEQYQIETVFAYLDNDDGGQTAGFKIANWCNDNEVNFGSMNYLYEDYKDANDMHVNGVMGGFAKNPIPKARLYPQGVNSLGADRLEWLATRPALNGFEI